MLTDEAEKAKSAVKAVAPAAFAMQDHRWRVYRDPFAANNPFTPGSVLGKGPTEDDAWLAAAAGLEGREGE